MKRTTISWPEELAEAVQREARRRHMSVSEIVREALHARYGANRPAPRTLPFAAVGASGHRDVAERFDEILGRAWAADLEYDCGRSMRV